MSANKFPDSIEKEELRRRDRRLLERFIEEVVARKLDYCGLPSAEFLDIGEWRNLLRSVTALEYHRDVADEMRLERDIQGFDFPVEIVEGKIQEYLQKTDRLFDVYNLDFFGGLLYRTDTQLKALAALFHRHGQARRPFTLITTLNVRDQGAEDYDAQLGTIGTLLKGRASAAENIKVHKRSQATRIKLCYPFYCLTQATPQRLRQDYSKATLYQTSAQMIHFHQRFLCQDEMLLPDASATTAGLIDLANKPLWELKEMIPQMRLEPPRVE